MAGNGQDRGPHETQSFEFGIKAAGVEGRAKVPTKKIAETISVILGMAVVALAIALFFHDARGKDERQNLKQQLDDNNGEVIKTIKDTAAEQKRATELQTELLRAMLSEQREQTCLQRFPIDERAKQADFCRRIGKQIRGPD